MKISTLLVALFAGAAIAAPAPAEEATLEKRASTCSWPVKRKEFRNLNILEKTNFFLSMKCLMTKPSSMRSKYPLSKSRYDDFLHIHQEYTPQIHWVGQFLPWHRAFLQDFENALQQECLYFGGLPYWNTALDYKNVAASPLMNGLLSFGGNGVGPVVAEDATSQGNCINSGFFKNERVHIKQGALPAKDDRCILRYFRQEFAEYWLNPDKIDLILAQKTFQELSPKIEGDLDFANPFPLLGIHTGGHAVVGGEMADMYTSPADPLFYVFHAQLDRLWAKWQAANPTDRQYQVGNPIAPRGLIQIWPDAPAGNVTLDYVLAPLNVGGSKTGTTVGQIMNTKGKGKAPATGKPAGILCYEYQG